MANRSSSRSTLQFLSLIHIFKAAAQSAGMTKPTTDQIEYIELGGANMAEICRPASTGPLAQAWNWGRNGVDAVVEYFR